MKASHGWPVAIVGVLVVTVAANGFLLWAANDRNGAVVEPDYYRKALAWDSTAALRAQGDALGWRIDAGIGPLDGSGRGWVTARLTDRDGAPVTGATVRVTAIHNLEAARHLEAALPAVGDGYAAEMALRHTGLWELRFDVARGSDRFATVARREAARAAAPGAGR